MKLHSRGSAHSFAKETLTSSLTLLREAALETLWPTRCVICDMPGTLLCHRCRVNLSYLDQLRACPCCGAANGIHICTECNHFILNWKHLERFELDACVSATQLTPQTKRIITGYKDRGEQRLAPLIAQFMAEVLPYSWKNNAVLVPIPTRQSAKKTRGFDHLCLITNHLQKQSSLPAVSALAVKTRKDQRLLGGQERLTNMSTTFTLHTDARKMLLPYRRIILVDDVMTTGATLFAAARILRLASSASICALTFSRA